MNLNKLILERNKFKIIFNDIIIKYKIVNSQYPHIVVLQHFFKNSKTYEDFLYGFIYYLYVNYKINNEFYNELIEGLFEIKILTIDIFYNKNKTLNEFIKNQLIRNIIK